MLKGSYTKYFKFQSLVTVDDLHRINEYLHSRCDKVIYNFETSDGADYDADVIEKYYWIFQSIKCKNRENYYDCTE